MCKQVADQFSCPVTCTTLAWPPPSALSSHLTSFLTTLLGKGTLCARACLEIWVPATGESGVHAHWVGVQVSVCRHNECHYTCTRLVTFGQRSPFLGTSMGEQAAHSIWGSTLRYVSYNLKEKLPEEFKSNLHCTNTPLPKLLAHLHWQREAWERSLHQ